MQGPMALSFEIRTETEGFAVRLRNGRIATATPRERMLSVQEAALQAGDGQSPQAAWASEHVDPNEPIDLTREEVRGGPKTQQAAPGRSAVTLSQLGSLYIAQRGSAYTPQTPFTVDSDSTTTSMLGAPGTAMLPQSSRAQGARRGPEESGGYTGRESRQPLQPELVTPRSRPREATSAAPQRPRQQEPAATGEGLPRPQGPTRPGS
jgi:hypothetical protein